MADTKPSSIPTLTVYPDYGNAPFLWRDRVCVCDGVSHDESTPMSEMLWKQFSDWAIEFEHFFGPDPMWDWRAFHLRGLQLARCLKDEVGDTYRIVYAKPYEDPNIAIDSCTEFLADGSTLTWNDDPFEDLHCFCRHIVSGGQTGADRAALDFAIEHSGYTHGGWLPQGRLAEDGAVPPIYQLSEVDGSYRKRTKRNVEDSDGTLILNLGELADGSLFTLQCAQKLGKPLLVIQLDDTGLEASARNMVEWLDAHGINKLNVAGPRESKRPGMYAAALAFLKRADYEYDYQLTRHQRAREEASMEVEPPLRRP